MYMEYKYCDNCKSKNTCDLFECKFCGCKLDDYIYTRKIITPIVFTILSFFLFLIFNALFFVSYGEETYLIEFLLLVILILFFL